MDIIQIIFLPIIGMGNCVSSDDVANKQQLASKLGQDINLMQHYMKIFEQIQKQPNLLPQHTQAHVAIKNLLTKNDEESLMKLGKACQTLRLYNNAIRCYNEYCKISSQPILKSIIETNTAQCYMEVGKPTEALKIYQRLLQNQVKCNGSKTYEYVKLLQKVACAKSQLGFNKEAITMLNEAAEIIEHLQLVDIPEYSEILCKLAQLHIEAGELHKGIQQGISASKQISKISQQSTYKSQTTLTLSLICHQISDPNLSLYLCQKSVPCSSSSSSSSSVHQCPQLINSMFYKIMILKDDVSKQKQVNRLLNECEEIILRRIGKQSIYYCQIIMYRGVVNLVYANNVAAVKCFVDSISMYQMLGESCCEAVAFIYVHLAQAYYNIGSVGKFKQVIQKAQWIIKQLQGQTSIQSAQFGYKLMELINSKQRYKQTIESGLEIISIYKKLKQEDNPNYLHLQLQLSMAYLCTDQIENSLLHCQFVFNNSIFKGQNVNNCIYRESCQVMRELYKRAEVSIDQEERQRKIDELNDVIHHIQEFFQNQMAKSNQIRSIMAHQDKQHETSRVVSQPN